MWWGFFYCARFAEDVDRKRRTVNHGLRHPFKPIGREAGTEDSVLDAICGHAPSSVVGAYGGVSVAAQTRALERFPRFDVDSGLLDRGVRVGQAADVRRGRLNVANRLIG
jgi:hypothetical protein